MKITRYYSIRQMDDYPLKLTRRVKTNSRRSIIDFEDFSPGFKKSTRTFHSDILFLLNSSRCYKCFTPTNRRTKGIIESSYGGILSLEEKSRK